MGASAGGTPWGIAVHPYDAGDPRANLTSRGIYTFATLQQDVSDYQCAQLQRVAGVPRAQCSEHVAGAMWASEQGWPRSASMTKALQARNICLAHSLSLAQGVWAVTHNFLQGSVPSTQGGAGDFSLLDEPPIVTANLSTAAGHATWDAYASTNPDVWGVGSEHYCCTQWKVGCAAATATA